MQTVNIHCAKTHLSHLLEMAAAGDAFIIAKAGKPMVKVSALKAPVDARKIRLGFMRGRCRFRRTSTGWVRRRSTISSPEIVEVPA